MATRIKRMTASDINDYIFMAFPAGWFSGCIAGAAYAGFNWNNLQEEIGRTIFLDIWTYVVG